MFRFLLLVSQMGMLTGLLNSTDQTVTVSKNLPETENVTKTHCGKQCNETCFLNNQNLDVFPACLTRTVEHLNLNFNNIAVIRDQDVVVLSELRVLSLSHNQITEIQWGIHVLANLESLDLSHNQLSVVPRCIMLKNVKWLSLAGNPISHIHTFAFSCFPSLESLNLSSTLIGKVSSEGIEESAFALNSTESQEDSLKSLNLLDLSGTYLRSVNQSWSKDLSNLKELHIRKMINMERLEEELLKWFPQLEFLNCADSSALTYVRTQMFENASKLKYLYFQNCNLKFFPAWNITSDSLTIDLSGNQLTCNCELDWLFSNHVNISLTRANETFCSFPKGDLPSVSILQLHNQCQSNKPDNENQELTTSSSTTMNPNNITGTLKSTLKPHDKGRKGFLTENNTVFKPTSVESDSTTSSYKIQTGSATQKTTTITQHVFSQNGFGGSSTGNKYATASTLMSSTIFLNPTSTTKARPDNEQTKSERITKSSKVMPCDYDHCRHLQTPCFELQQLTPCLCPGLSGEDIIPDPPYLKEVSEITDTSAQIHWCSSNSIVKRYEIVYQPEGGKNKTIDKFYVTMRQYTLYNLVPFTTYKVCVVGFNKKGPSVPKDTTSTPHCTEFKTKPSYILTLAILSALGGLFLVIITVLSVCLYKTCKNNIVNQYDTHLVSYKNPAFAYHLTIPSYH